MGHGGLKWKGKADCHALYEVILGHPGSVSLSLSVFPLPLPFPSCPPPAFLSPPIPGMLSLGLWLLLVLLLTRWQHRDAHGSG